jgi:hypothetical protein
MMRLRSMKYGLIACVVAAIPAFAQSTPARTTTDAPAVL